MPFVLRRKRIVKSLYVQSTTVTDELFIYKSTLRNTVEKHTLPKDTLDPI